MKKVKKTCKNTIHKSPLSDYFYNRIKFKKTPTLNVTKIIEIHKKIGRISVSRETCKKRLKNAPRETFLLRPIKI